MRIDRKTSGKCCSLFSGVAGGEEVSLPGFGKFKVKETPERDGRNPPTSAVIKNRRLQEAGVHTRQGVPGRAQRVMKPGGTHAPPSNRMTGMPSLRALSPRFF